MSRLTILASTLLLGATTALAPSPASAASGVFGNTCTAISLEADYTLIMTTGSPSNPIPVAAPSAGVITTTRFVLPSEADGSYPQKVKVLRPTGVPNQYTVIAESSFLTVTAGASTFDVRLPVAAGDLLGLYGGALGTFFCDTDVAGDVIGVTTGDAPVGAPVTYGTEPGYALPVSGTVEPDADQDGYGDLTQDQCPESATLQTECPVVVLDSYATSQGNAIAVIVGTDNKAKVKVTATAKVNGKKIKFQSGAKTVKPGKLAQFKLQLPKPLRNALRALPRSKFIKVTLVAKSTDSLGRKAKDKTSIKLYGSR